MESVLPAARLDISIEGTGEEARAITLRAGSPELARYLEALP